MPFSALGRFKLEKKIGATLIGFGFVWMGLSVFLQGWRPSSTQNTLALQNTPQPDNGQQKYLTCTVMQIYDGDTFGCDLNHDGAVTSALEHVRLLGIDCPEMSYSKKNKSHRNQPYAVEAIRFMEQSTLNKQIYLELDQRPRDRYGRLLAFAYTRSPKPPVAEGSIPTSLNEQLVQQGWATLLFIPPNELYHAPLQKALEEAQAHKKGLWQ